MKVEITETGLRRASQPTQSTFAGRILGHLSQIQSGSSKDLALDLGTTERNILPVLKQLGRNGYIRKIE